MKDNNAVGWFYESAAQKNSNQTPTPKSSFTPYMQEGTKSIDAKFEELCDHYKESSGIDIKKDMTQMLSDRAFMEDYKTSMFSDISEGFREMSPNDPHIETIIENAEKFWDTKVRIYTESASMTGFLPIATLEFPVLLKQFFTSILKDIIEVESVKVPAIAKHVRTTYLVDNNTGDEYEYPKCMWDGTWEKVWDASKGHPIAETVVPLTNGRIHKYDVITNLTNGIPGIDQISFQFKIIGIDIGGIEIPLRGNGITVEFSTNGTFVNGDLNFTDSVSGTVVEDTLSGRVNFKDGTVDLSSSVGQVTGVIFSGYLSNEKNIRTVSIREKRSILRFNIEDGPRWNMPFSIEDIDDAAALLDINYYNRMVDEIVKTQEMQESMTVIKFLNDEFAKYNGVAADIYQLESLAMTHEVDLKAPVGFAGDPFKYVTSAVQFKVRAILHQLSEAAKLDNLSFVIVGNPMAIQLITEFTTWKVEQGTNIGGVTVNNSYGFATHVGANVRAVSTNVYDAYTVAPITSTGDRELVLHIYAYPTDPEHISFRHLKYTSHLLTSQSQTAYQSVNAPGGAYNVVTATSRFHTMSVQGIQARLILLNSETIYGPAPTRPPVTGAPWS